MEIMNLYLKQLLELMVKKEKKELTIFERIDIKNKALKQIIEKT